MLVGAAFSFLHFPAAGMFALVSTESTASTSILLYLSFTESMRGTQTPELG